MVEFNLKKIIYLILIIILIVALVIVVPKVTKKKDTKKEDIKTEEKVKEPEKGQEQEELDESDIELPPGDIAKTVKCTAERTEENVLSSKLYVTFNLDEKNKVISREDVREYKFDKIDTDEYMSNKTVGLIANTLNKINGISSTLSTIDRNEHTYRFTTIFDFRIIKLDDLYNQYYKVYYTEDMGMNREDFDKRYKSLKYDDMVQAYIGDGYVCK